jgi:hypothetical protein
MINKNSVFAVLMAACLTACGGGGGSAGSVQESAAGVWTGSVNPFGYGDGSKSIGVISDSGEYFFLTGDSFIEFGTAKVSGSTISSDNLNEANLATGDMLEGSFSGSFVPRSSLSLIANSEINGQKTVGTANFVFLDKYNQASSLATIVGYYVGWGSFGTTGNVAGSAFGEDRYSYTVDAVGVLTGVSEKCLLNGRLSPNNYSQNIFNLSITTSHAPGQLCQVGARTLDGIGIDIRSDAGVRSLILFSKAKVVNLDKHYHLSIMAGERQ